MSDAAELKALAGETYTVTSGGVEHRVSAMRVRQLGAVIERSTTLLPLIAARADELEADPAATLADLVVSNFEECAALLQLGTELPAEVVDAMSIDELIGGFAAFLKNNPLFFSRMLRLLAEAISKQVAANQGSAQAGSTPPSGSSEQDTATAT